MKHAVDDSDFDAYIYRLFETNFSMGLEPQVFDTAKNLSADYGGGTWDFFALSNGGFFMSPRHGIDFEICCASGARVRMSAEAFGITVCLFVFSHLSFGRGPFAEACGRHYYLLRAFAFEHLEASVILRATD